MSVRRTPYAHLRMELAAADTSPVCCVRCDALTRNARKYADLLGLRDWVVDVAHGPPRDPTQTMSVTLATGRRHLELRAASEFDELDEEDQRHALTHELVHAVVRELADMHETVAREAYGGVAYRVHMEYARRRFEETVDHMATVWARSMPEFTW